jgi:hypothetical protein
MQIMWTSASYLVCFALSSVRVMVGVIKINLVAFFLYILILDLPTSPCLMLFYIISACRQESARFSFVWSAFTGNVADALFYRENIFLPKLLYHLNSFQSTVFQDLTVKLCSIYKEMLIDITEGFVGGTILMRLLNLWERLQSWMCFVLCPYRKCSGHFALMNIQWLV